MLRSLIVFAVLCICARCAAQTAIQLPPDLRTLSSAHYLIHSDLDADLTRDLALRMDAMFEEYSRRFGDFSPPQDGPMLEVYLFARRHDYMRLTGDRFPNTGGIFISAQNLLAVFLEGQGREGIRRTLQHEAFHQFAQAAIGGDLPIWLNEGIAQIFEEGIWTGKTFLIGQVPPSRIQRLQDDILENRLTDFGVFINLSDAQWASNLRYRPIAATQYNQAWAMTQFLICASDENGRPKYRDRFLDMLHSIHAGQDGHSAFVEAFSSNTVGFQHLFNEWAHNLSPTAEAAYAEHQAILADMLITLASQGREFSDIASFRACLDEGGYRLQCNGSRDLPPGSFFCDLAGRPLGPSQLFFATSPGSVAPDLVCHPAGDLELRTHFVREGNRLDFETVVQSE